MDPRIRIRIHPKMTWIRNTAPQGYTQLDKTAHLIHSGASGTRLQASNATGYLGTQQTILCKPPYTGTTTLEYLLPHSIQVTLPNLNLSINYIIATGLHPPPSCLEKSPSHHSHIYPVPVSSNIYFTYTENPKS
jgi:hypothetical protein